MSAVTLERPTLTFGDVVVEGVGARIQARRMALGMTVKDLAELAGVDRGRLAKIEAGENARTSTIGAIEAALTQVEEEVSGPYDDPITSTIELPDGTKITWQGSREGVAEEVRRFLEERRR